MQVYLALSNEENIFIVSRKQEFCSFWHGQHGRRKLVNQAGQWSFPGGKVELNESPITAALREFQQETGVLTENWDRYCELIYSRVLETGEIQFSLVLCSLNSRQGFNVTDIAHQIDSNLSENEGRPKGDHVTDWELQYVAMVPRAMLTEYLGHRVAVSSAAAAAIARLPNNHHSQSIDWYGVMARFLVDPHAL